MFAYFYFCWWKDFRVPTTTTKVKVATAGRAFGVWYDNTNTFQFKLPAGICAAEMSFMGTTGIHEFHFTLDSAKVSHIAWEDIDYEHTSDAFLLECAFNRNGKKPQVVDLPLPRVTDISRYHNPTRPSHLREGVLVRHRRSHSPNEIRSVQAMGLEQSPAYLSKGINSRNRARSVSQPRSNSGGNSLRERDQEKSPHPLFVQKHKESSLAEEILDLHLRTEVDLDLHQSQEYVQTLHGKDK